MDNPIWACRNVRLGDVKPPQETIIRTHAELADFWSNLIRATGPGPRTLWLILIEDGGQVLPTIIPIDDVEARPDLQLIEELGRVVSEVSGEHRASAAFLLARPGSETMTSPDREWARALDAIARDRRWPVHLASGGRVQVFAPDDLIAA